MLSANSEHTLSNTGSRTSACRSPPLTWAPLRPCSSRFPPLKPPGGKHSASAVPRLFRRYHPVWRASPLPLRCLFLIDISRAPLLLVPLASLTSPRPARAFLTRTWSVGPYWHYLSTPQSSGGRTCLQSASSYL
ncbi:uncharacterized protein LACBIDRAFT_312441 [Laccaria bicolor S238N-H82]|uniref:Predicted protein n=1 Tax=Laccaria bicolor (strain S238N-H82 / ATCC MYA-4686) TaxID=486041 RepID=B0DW63_LACBS|nr:uncharacterized protein LACBIDRAFT_312441 [Laccaria bicolor S238N-H82]EDR01127.1 predicted protein [Laccaria bicolor S238N-H82]|eukprot:XP_001888169.1 predicted protein [Laccaria bicolor S238N-H82]